MAKKSSIHSNLKRTATTWAGKLTRLAKALAPNHLKGYIHSKSEEMGDGKFIIRLLINTRANPLQKYGSLDARAQEYGSGEHARRGTKRKYLILPKNKKLLAFPWDIADANPERFSFLPDGRVVLSSVQSPGIEAYNNGKGYLGPAVIELKKTAKAELGKELRDAIMSDIRTSFSGRFK